MLLGLLMELVVLEGVGFVPGARVYFDGIPATEVEVLGERYPGTYLTHYLRGLVQLQQKKRASWNKGPKSRGRPNRRPHTQHEI